MNREPFSKSPGACPMIYHNRCLAVLLVTALVIGSSCLGADEKKSQAKGGDKDGGERNPALLDPSLAKDKAPDKFKAKFTTTKGDFVIEVTRDWAPNGADRFYNLVKIGYFNDIAFFRNIEGFMVQ